MDLKTELAAIVRPEYVFDARDILDSYSRDKSFATAMKPRLVAKPGNADEVQAIVKWANATRTPLIPVSSGPPRFRGDTVPSAPGAVIVDLSRMDRVLRVDRRNRMTIVEPGVTYGQLQERLAGEGLRVSMPLLPRRSKSVLTSLLEREPRLTPRYQWQMPDPLKSTEVIWGNGDRMRTGEAGVHRAALEEQWKMGLAQGTGWGPRQVDYYRFVQAAQGSMGIVTWVSIRCEILPQAHKLFLVSSEQLEPLVDLAYQILKFRFADELLILNNTDLACISQPAADKIGAAQRELPPWVLVVGIAGREFLPQERIQFQENDIGGFAQQRGLRVVPAVPGMGGPELLSILSQPSPDPYWKLRRKGACQDIFFITTLDKAPGLTEVMRHTAQETGYPPLDIGVYIQPVVQGVACHCEFNIPYDPGNAPEVSLVRELTTRASETLVSHGAFFSRPYDTWAPLVYNRDAQTTIVLRKIKNVFDPGGVMNPGKLCFQ